MRTTSEMSAFLVEIDALVARADAAFAPVDAISEQDLRDNPCAADQALSDYEQDMTEIGAEAIRLLRRLREESS